MLFLLFILSKVTFLETSMAYTLWIKFPLLFEWHDYKLILLLRMLYKLFLVLVVALSKELCSVS